MSKVRKLVALFLAVGFLVGILFVGELEARPKRCFAKRKRCFAKCEKRAARYVAKCKRRVLSQRARCLKNAYRQGKRCFRKTECPAAEKCYEMCNEKPDPYTCYLKRGCAKIQKSCYASCQYPIGQHLKQCLTETAAKLKGCSKGGERELLSCKASCPKCE